MRATVSTSVKERRRARRYAVALPIDLSTTRTVTVNVSTGGVLFEAPAGDALETGSALRFVLAIGTVAMRLRCRGRVVRVERSAARCCVASTIDHWEIDRVSS